MITRNTLIRGGALLAAALPVQIGQRPAANATVSDDGFAVLERYVAGVNGHDAGAIGACVAPDYLQHSGRSPSGREALEMVFRGLFAGIPDVVLSVEDRLAAGDRIVARCTYRGTHLGTLFGIAPTKRTVQLGTIDIWRVESGVFIEHWDQVDFFGLFKQIGFPPTQPNH